VTQLSTVAKFAGSVITTRTRRNGRWVYDLDPRVNFLSWKAALFKIISGCLFLVQTKTEFDAFPLHLKADGSVIQRPTVVAPDPPETNDKVIVCEVYARDLDRHEGWVEVRA
jgi:hypothetical protein